MQKNHLMNEGPLLNEKGNLTEPGYAFSLVKEYSRSAIKAPKWRIKEWDYYYIGNDDYGLALTIADNGYMSMASISLLDFKSRKEETLSKIGLFPMGKLNLPSSSKSGESKIEGNGFDFSFTNDGKTRHLLCHIKGFGKKKETFRADILLEETTNDSLVIATPFRKKAHFYYNQKINCLRAHGYAKHGDKTYDFNSSFGVLDWGRGVWTYRNTWYWSSLSSMYNGHLIGWNLGYGFGDTSAASENIFYLDGKAFKLGDVKMEIPFTKNGDDYLSAWRFHSSNGDINITFNPIINRHTDTNLLILRSNQHQVFGLFSGTILLDGTPFQFENVMGFAEKVYNKW